MGENRPAASARWSDLGRRALSAAILAPIALLCIWVGGVPFVVLIIVAGVGLSIEWLGLCGVRDGATPIVLVPGLVLLAALVCVLLDARSAIALLACGCVVLWAWTRRALLAGGPLYIGLPLVCLLWLRGTGGGRESVLFLVLVIWATDIGAYLVGRLVGGRKLAPALSPGKTWSGAVGGLAAAILVGLLMPPRAPILALLLAVACQAGDLLESGIKRHVGVKDSGRLIPGHGGLLDRLDGLLAAAPVAAIAMLAAQGGHW